MNIIFSLYFLLKLNEIFYKQNLERFDKILVKNLMLMIQKKQKEELNNIKGINKEDDKEYALKYIQFS